MTSNPMTDTLDSTFLDDNPIAPGNYETSPHLEGIPHAHVVTLPTFCYVAYGLTLMASR